MEENTANVDQSRIDAARAAEKEAETIEQKLEDLKKQLKDPIERVSISNKENHDAILYNSSRGRLWSIVNITNFTICWGGKNHIRRKKSNWMNC